MLVMRTPRSGGKRWTTKEAPVPAPVGGWNRRDSVTVMQANEAIVLDNLIPTAQGVVVRKGYSEWATGLAGSYVETLMVYAPQDGNDAMFAAAPNGIYDVTAAGEVGAQVQGSLTNGRWTYVNFSTLGGNYLFAANGADAVRMYSGSAWTQPSLSGITSASVNFVTSHMQRLWFIPNNATSIYYLPVGQISGTVTELPLGPLMSLGGFIIAMASWTRDGGAGLDDVAVFLTSKGEALIYSGTDPDDAGTWNFVGRFRIPEPVGRNCVVKIGADVGVITSQGVLPLSAILPLSSSGQAKVAATDKISGAYNDIYPTAKSSHGWQVVESPADNLLIVNVPAAERVTAYQYVMSTQTGNWCRFTGINANCWAYFEGSLYFGGNDGKVYKYTGTKDGAAAINGACAHAYQAFGTPQTKIFDRANVIAFGPSGYIPGVSMRTNYDESLVTIQAPSYEGSGPDWDAVYWDDEFWGDSIVPVLGWQSVNGEGIVGSLNVGISSTESVTYNGALLTYRVGGPV